MFDFIYTHFDILIIIILSLIIVILNFILFYLFYGDEEIDRKKRYMAIYKSCKKDLDSSNQIPRESEVDKIVGEEKPYFIEKDNTNIMDNKDLPAKNITGEDVLSEMEVIKKDEIKTEDSIVPNTELQQEKINLEDSSNEIETSFTDEEKLKENETSESVKDAEECNVDNNVVDITEEDAEPEGIEENNIEECKNIKSLNLLRTTSLLDKYCKSSNAKKVHTKFRKRDIVFWLAIIFVNLALIPLDMYLIKSAMPFYNSYVH